MRRRRSNNRSISSNSSLRWRRGGTLPLLFVMRRGVGRGRKRGQRGGREGGRGRGRGRGGRGRGGRGGRGGIEPDRTLLLLIVIRRGVGRGRYSKTFR